MKMIEALRQRISPGRPGALARRLRRMARPAWLGTLRSTTPLSSDWGWDRGTALDRYYIDAFLERSRADITGRVLEVQDLTYTERFGSGVTHADILDPDVHNINAMYRADLACADVIASDTFDCFILTQTLQLILDTRAAVRHAHRILRPGGVLLATVPSVSRIPPDYGARGLQTDFWRFTVASCSAIFGQVFGAARTEVRSHGNVLAAIAFLAGMAHEELTRAELDHDDPFYPVIVTVRARKESLTA